jgi:hypothetical protein
MHPGAMHPAPLYDERLWPPVWLWIAGWVFSGLLAVSVHAALGPVWGLFALLVPGALLTWGLISSAARVRVADGHLVAGPAHIPLEHLGPARPLDAVESRAVRGPESDPAGYHLIRGWVPAGVQMAVTDPGDPTPYWFVATRHPQALAAAIEAARAGD